jgi:nucleoside-diphosphate-sugar epimerase
VYVDEKQELAALVDPDAGRSTDQTAGRRLMKTALLIGGTAATGVAIAAALRGRGFEVTIYHRGIHEYADLDDLEHIHGDPHFPETIARDLGGRSWDVTVATYGRIRHIAEHLRGRTGHLVTVSGIPAVKLLPGVPISERDPYADPADAPAGLKKLVPRIVETERAVLEAHAAGHFTATVVRYPYVYGPRSVVPMEWHVLKRVLDGRRRWIVPEGGLAIRGRCASVNAARLVGLVLGRPRVTGGEVYHAADTRQYTLREWVTMVAAAAGHEFEFVDIPSDIVPLGVSAVPMAAEYSSVSSRSVDAGGLRHALVSNEKARRDLGYEDVVTPEKWIGRTVEHWLRNPPAVDGAGAGLTPQDFDYAAEDALLAYWDRVVACAPVEGMALGRNRQCPHPKNPVPQALTGTDADYPS